MVELQLQLTGFLGAAQGVQRLQGDFGEIHFARLLKHQPELCCRHLEHGQQVGDEGAVVAAVVRLGQAPHPRKRRRRRFGQRLEAALEGRRQRLVAGAAQAVGGRDFLARAAFLRQQQLG